MFNTDLLWDVAHQRQNELYAEADRYRLLSAARRHRRHRGQERTMRIG
jgi:hypothetical protein